ncbi:MAG: hypothetical protein GC190_01775 [Alphaproteobacteria bacterium]|nr:hypothetical protein [Alphaproteobacteria bacterium]
MDQRRKVVQMYFKTIIAVAASLVLTGCGYSLRSEFDDLCADTTLKVFHSVAKASSYLDLTENGCAYSCVAALRSSSVAFVEFRFDQGQYDAEIAKAGYNSPRRPAPSLGSGDYEAQLKTDDACSELIAAEALGEKPWWLKFDLQRACLDFKRIDSIRSRYELSAKRVYKADSSGQLLVGRRQEIRDRRSGELIASRASYSIDAIYFGYVPSRQHCGDTGQLKISDAFDNGHT